MSVKSAVKIPDHLVEGGQEDRAYLASLPELEREAILFERAEKATRAAQKQEILDQLKSAQQQQQKPTAKRGKDDDFYDSDSDSDDSDESDGYGFSDSDDLNVKDSGQRGESDFEDSNSGGGKKRLKTERSDRQSKLEKLRRQRKKKGDDQEEGEIDISLLSPPLSDDYSDHHQQQQQQQRPTFSSASATSVDRIEDADLQSLQIPRTLAEKLIHLPLFQQKCTGLFVRVFIGLQDGTKLPVYRCCQILAVEPYPRTYRLTDGSKCALSLRLAFGSSERNFRIDILSNSPLTPAEIGRWRSEMRRKKLSPSFPTGEKWNASSLAGRRASLKHLQQHQLSDTDVDTILKARSGNESSRQPLHIQKSDLMSRLALLESEGTDLEAIAGAREQLARIDEEMGSSRKAAKTRLDKWSALNERNRQRNAVDVRKAQQRDLQKSIKQGSSGGSEEGKAGKGEQRIDVFARRKAKNVHSFVQAMTSASASATATTSKIDTKVEGKKPAVSQPASPKKPPLQGLDLQSLHGNLDLDLEISPIDFETREL